MKCTRSGAILCLAALAVTTAGAAAAYAGSDWPRFLGPSGDGKSPETEIRLSWPAEGPPVVFRQAVGEGYAMPVVAGRRLFQFDRHGDAERLTCMDALTGAVLWQSEAPTTYEDTYGFGNGPRSSPAVDDDPLLYVAGHLVVLTERGRLLLVRATPEGFRQMGAAGSAPVVGYPAWNAPILSRGILYVRGKRELLGYDLRLPPEGPPAAEP